MSLATEALNALPHITGFNPTCHVATWYWAAQVAQKTHRCATKSPTKTVHNVKVIPEATIVAEAARLNL